MFHARDQYLAARQTGDYEQWRDNPWAARKFLGRPPYTTPDEEHVHVDMPED